MYNVDGITPIHSQQQQWGVDKVWDFQAYWKILGLHSQ